MLEPSELRVTGPNGESEINLGTVVTSTHRKTHLNLALQNTSRRPIVVNLHLSGPMADVFSISSVRDVKLDRSGQRQPAVLQGDPYAALNRNLVEDRVRDASTIEIPRDSRRLCRLALIDVSVPSPLTDTSQSRHLSLTQLDGSIELQDLDTSVQLNTFKLRSTVCESWIRPDSELLDFGHCTLGEWLYRDIGVRNLSQIPARCCFAYSFRPTVGPEIVMEFSFIDPESGYELDPKIVRIEPSAARCIRIAFRATALIEQDYWMCLQNLDNAKNFWHLHIVAKVGAKRIAQNIIVSCGTELDFGDCYVNCPTFRDVVVQSNYEEDVTLALRTNKSNEVSFELLNEWSIGDTGDLVAKKTRPRTTSEYDGSMFSLNEVSDTRFARRQSSSIVEDTFERDTDSKTSGVQYYGPHPTDRDERVDAHQGVKKRNRSPESVLIRPGQKRGVRVWYTPETTSRKRSPDSKEINDLHPGALQDETFLLSFELSSGQSRTVVGQSRVCESVVRLERNEVRLGNCNVMTRYRTTLSLINCSDLPAFVSINYVSQCVFADAHEFRILPRQAYDLGLGFIPRQVNPGYHKEVTVSNLRNPNAPNLVFTLKADCVDDQGVSLHALFYKLLAPKATNEIDFGVTVANHPAIRAIKVRNITDKRLILEFDGCPNVTTYLPSGTRLDASRYQSRISRQANIVGKCVCQRKSVSTSLRTKNSVVDSDSHITANALVDMDISRPRLEPGSDERQNLPVWQFESSLASLHQYRNRSDSSDRSFNFQTTSQHDEPSQPMQGSKQTCWVDFFCSMSEGKVPMLDSMPTFFSNYDSEIRYTEQQFRPKRNLRAAIRAGCLTRTTTLVLEARSESVVVLSFELNDRDVRGKTKIRPIEKHLSVRMIDFDRSRLIDLPETSSKQMHHMAKLLKEGNASRPREVLLTVQACKSRMSIAPLRQLNFGSITQGEQKDKAFTIVNLSEAPLLYEIRKTGGSTRDDIRFNLGRGTQGVVRPYFTKVVPFIFAPSCEGKYEERIVVENRLDRTASSELIVKAQIRARDLALERSL